jgi:hypothetical protein
VVGVGVLVGIGVGVGAGLGWVGVGAGVGVGVGVEILKPQRDNRMMTVMKTWIAGEQMDPKEVHPSAYLN